MTEERKLIKEGEMDMLLAEELGFVSDSPQDRAVRNLYAEMLNQLISDLRRGLTPDVMPKAIRAKVGQYRRLAMAWIEDMYPSEVSFSMCCSILGLQKSLFVAALKAKGLMPSHKKPVTKAIRDFLKSGGDLDDGLDRLEREEANLL